MRKQLFEIIINFFKRILLFTGLLIFCFLAGQSIGYLIIHALKYFGLEDNLFRLLDLITI